MKWHASDTMLGLATIVIMIVLRSTHADWRAGAGFFVNRNDLQGPIPPAVGSLTAVVKLKLYGNSLQGPIPPVIGSMIALLDVNMDQNSLRGPIPHAVGPMIGLQFFYARENNLQGPIPHALGSMIALRLFAVLQNSLRGPLPHAIGSIALTSLDGSDNRLQGPIPDAVGSMLALNLFMVARNSLSGTIPAAVTSCMSFMSVHCNELSGTIPSGLFTQRQMRLRGGRVLIHGNRLTGSLPALKDLEMLVASGNLLEGRIPGTFNSKLSLLDLSGVPGRSVGLKGPLPPGLRRVSGLKSLTMANQQMDGAIPSFTSNLSLLALHKNHFKVLHEFYIGHQESKTVILLHDNLLSCYLPMCGNASVNISIVAIGNQLRYPKGEFPAWVSEYEHDALFWVSDNDGMSLMLKISGAVGSFVLVVVLKLGPAQLLRAMSEWQIGLGTHSWLVKASSHLHAVAVIGSSLAALLIMFLLSWDLYVCPQTLAMLSACSRSSSLIRTLVFLWWCKLSFHSPAVQHLTMEGEKQTEKKWTAKIWRKRLLWLLWWVLTMVLATPLILYQVAKSIPGSLQAGPILLLALKACIGGTQALVGNFIVPYLASKMSRRKHVFTTVSSLLLSCVIPAVVIIYLDTACLGRWVLLWKQCRSTSSLFQYYFRFPSTYDIDVMVLRQSDICEPHFSWSSNSMSRCIHISLLRLQEIWLTKFITTGLVMPGVNLLRNELPKECGAIVGNFGIYMAYAMLTSGHLPLMNFILLLAFLGEGLVARVAWAQKCFQALYVQNVAAPVLKMSRLLSLMVHLASVAGDRRVLALASAYIFMLIMAPCIGMRRVAGL